MEEEDGKKRFKCSLCELSFTQKFARTRHERQQHRELVANPDPLFQCPIPECPYETPRIPDLRTHYNSVHQPAQGKKTRKSRKKKVESEDGRTASPPPQETLSLDPTTPPNKESKNVGNRDDTIEPNTIKREGPKLKTTKRKRCASTCSSTPTHTREYLYSHAPNWVREVTNSTPSGYSIPRVKPTATATSDSVMPTLDENDDRSPDKLKKKERRLMTMTITPPGMPSMPNTRMTTSPPTYTVATSPISDICADETVRVTNILSIPDSPTPNLKITTLELPLDLSTRARPVPSDKETEEAAKYLEKLMNPPEMAPIERTIKSPAAATINGYEYTEDTTPTPTRDENTPPKEEEVDHILLGDLNLSGSSGTSGTSSGDTIEQEARTTQARFKALFYVDNIGDHTTELRMRIPRIYDCAQS